MSALATILDLALYDSIVLENRLLTAIVSAPFFFKNAAASNVLTPVFIIKFLVSNIIPDSRASAEYEEILLGILKY